MLFRSSRCGVVTGTILGFSLMQLHDCKGERDERKRGENHERDEWGNDRKHSNKQKRDGDEEASHNTMGGNLVLYSTLPSRPSQMTCLLYIDLLKGGATLKLP